MCYKKGFFKNPIGTRVTGKKNGSFLLHLSKFESSWHHYDTAIRSAGIPASSLNISIRYIHPIIQTVYQVLFTDVLYLLI